MLTTTTTPASPTSPHSVVGPHLPSSNTLVMSAFVVLVLTKIGTKYSHCHSSNERQQIKKLSTVVIEFIQFKIKYRRRNGNYCYLPFHNHLCWSVLLFLSFA